MVETGYTLNPIGVVRSSLTDREEAPRQGYEGAATYDQLWWMIIDLEVQSLYGP